MAKTKYYNKTTQQWEYAETGRIPVRGTHYWVAQDLKPLHDYISSRVMATAEVCFLTVMVTSNQSDKSALEGLALSVTFPDGRTAEVEAGSVIAFTEGSVTVQFPEVAGYKRPDNLSVSYAKGSVSETATYLAEEVTVNALVDGVASSEFSYEVSGDGIVCLTGSGTSFTGVTKWLVPHGVTITVTPATVDGYTTGTVTHTASGVTGSVSVEWAEVKLGVFIEDVNGKLWTESEWDGSVEPNGIAVCTENCRFVADFRYQLAASWSDSENLFVVDGIVTTESESEASLDFEGKANSEKIIEQVDGTPGALGVQTFLFPNGQTAYLGSGGELMAVVNNRAAINSAVYTSGINQSTDILDSMFETGIWTSTQVDASYAWYAAGSGLLIGHKTDTAYYLLPFTTLKMDTV